MCLQTRGYHDLSFDMGGPHTRKESCFLPLKCKAILPHMGKESSLLSPKCKAVIDHKSFPIYYNREGLYFLQNAKLSQILLLIYVKCNFLFLFYFFFFFFLLFPLLILFFFFLFLFFFFFKTWNSSPKEKNYSLAFEANKRRIDDPGHEHSRKVEQKPGGRGREYNNLPFKMHCDSIITRS